MTAITPEQWQKVKPIFHAALERPVSARPAFLDEACKGDAKLRAEIEALLAAHEDPNDFLAQPAVAEALPNLFTETHELLAGQRLGGYEIQRKLGQGGMGEVYLARDSRLGRLVALKVLPASLTRDTDRVRRFQQEARAASALNHPNILTIYEVGQADGVDFIATEYIEGPTLRALLKRGELTLGAVLDIVIQAGQALEASHRAGIIHRDIKPENLMRRDDGFVKALDFGLAKLTERPADWATADFSRMRTRPGVVMGTVTYMSPEQARGHEVDARSDVFSLGVVLYEMLTGRVPFEGESMSDVIAALLAREPQPLDTHISGLPTAFQHIVARALQKRREDRYASATEMLTDLRALNEDLAHTAKLKRSGTAKSAQQSLLEMRVGRSSATEGERRATGNTPARRTSTLGSTMQWTLQWMKGHRRLTVTSALSLIVAVAIFQAWSSGKIKFEAGDFKAIDSVAVLPFVNASNDAEIEYLTDGITDNLMQSLQSMPGLRVMARGTINTYKGRVVDPRQVGQELKVKAVITGRVQRQGDRLMVSAELAETRDGAQLWSEHYQRPLDDLSALQDQLAREIALKLRPQLANTATPQSSTTPAIKSEAYQLYLKGRYFQRQASQASGEKALALFNQAIQLEPKFALPHSGIALVYQNFSSQSLSPREAIERARQAALTALALDNQLAEAHYAMAMVKVLDWDWAGAEQEYQQTLALNPDYIDARYSYGGILARFNRHAEARAELERAVETDPLSQQVCQGLASIYFYSHLVDRAREQCRKTIELDPKGGWASGAHRLLATMLIEEKRYAEAVEEFRLAYEIVPTESTNAWLAYGYTRVGKVQEARAILRELQAAARDHWVSPAYLARIHIGLGEYDQAIARLRESYAAQSDHLIHLGVEPVYDPIRHDPRFIEILRGVGLPQ